MFYLNILTQKKKVESCADVFFNGAELKKPWKRQI